MRPHSCRALSTVARVVGVAGLVVLATACSESDVLEVRNACSEPARVVTWGGSDPVLDVVASGVAETTDFSNGPVSLVTRNGLVKLTPSEPDSDDVGPRRYMVSVSEALCGDLGDDIVDVIVVDDVFMGDEPDPVRIRLYSADPAHLQNPTPIVSAFTGGATTTSQGPGFVAVEFVPDGPTDWNGDDVEFDATDAVEAALSIAGSGTVVLDCSTSYDCANVATAPDSRLARPFIVAAQTPGTVTDNETFQTILGMVILIALAALPVVIIRRNRRKRRARRAGPTAWPPPTVPG